MLNYTNRYYFREATWSRASSRIEFLRHVTIENFSSRS